MDHEEIHLQKGTARELLRRLRESGFTAVVAGGAPRDWYFGNGGTDLDIFVLGSPSYPRAALEDALRTELVPATSRNYRGANFKTYNGPRVLGTPIQVMSDGNSSPRELIDRFECNMSKTWYDGERSYYHRHFLLGAKYKMVVGEEPRLVSKTERRLRGKTGEFFNGAIGGTEDLLRMIGGAPKLGFWDEF